MRYNKLVIAILAMCSTVCIAQQVLNNDAIIKMHAAEMGDDLIVSVIGSQPGTYDTSADALVALKKAGIGDKIIGAMITKSSQPAMNPAATNASSQPVAGQPPAPIDQVPAGPPVESVREIRVFLQSSSKGNTQNADRDQSMEMSKDFEKDCPGVRITINQQMADYTVLLNHIEIGAFIRDNQIQVANKDGDLISKTKEGGSIDANVKKACAIVLADWGKKS